MTSDLTDLRARMLRARDDLLAMRGVMPTAHNVDEYNRLTGKTEGVSLALSYLDEAITQQEYPTMPMKEVREVHSAEEVTELLAADDVTWELVSTHTVTEYSEVGDARVGTPKVIYVMGRTERPDVP